MSQKQALNNFESLLFEMSRNDLQQIIRGQQSVRRSLTSQTEICSPLVSCVKNLGFSLIVYSLSYGTGTGGRSITSLSFPERVLLVVITSSVSNSIISTSGVIYFSLIQYSPSGCCDYPIGIMGRSMGSSSPVVSDVVFCSACVVVCCAGFDDKACRWVASDKTVEFRACCGHGDMLAFGFVR